MAIDPKYAEIQSFEEAIVNRFDRSNRANIGSIKSYLYRELQRLTTGQDGKHLDATSKANKELVKGIKTRLAAKLKGSAHVDPLNDLFAGYGHVIDYQKQIFEELGYDEVYDIATNDLTRLEMASQMPLTEIGGAQKVVNSEIRAAFNEVLFGKSTVNELAKTIDSKLDKLGSWGYTIATTGLMGFDRAVTDEMAKELGIDEFTYFNLKDKLNRPFCAAILAGRHPNTGEPHGKIWTRAEIEELDNGHKLDPMQYAGGYNCRHRWIPKPKIDN